MRLQTALLTFLSCVLVGTSAAARPSSPPPLRHQVSLFVDVTGLIFAGPTVRPALDLRLARKWSLEMSIGLGTRSTFASNQTSLGHQLAWDAAVRPRYYFLGNFDEGIHVGGALTFARVAGAGLSQQDLAEPPIGLSFGPTVGFKSTFFPLISVDIEIGALFRVVTPASAYQPSIVVPYAAFMIGRSF